MKLETTESNLKALNLILKKGKISEPLNEAVVSIIKAIKQNNVLLATDISSVKSLVSGSMNSKRGCYPYREDHDYNEKHLGNSVYSILDGIHFAYAIKSDKLPSGMVIFSSGGMTQGGKITELEDPVVEKINAEFKRTWEKTEEVMKS